ncbi:DUF1631 family protein [Hydrocarboniphaga sp.]|uniref:DUF1631 family protein n=1 Tax=Hydrocarboniphaga sp. TaxID=2033016 RepID=UPI003D101C57
MVHTYDPGRGPVSPSGGHPLVDELCEAAVEQHRQLLAALLRSVERAPAEARLQIDLASRLRLDRANLQRRYLREIGRRFDPLAQAQAPGGSAERELQRYTRPPAEALQEQMALDELARRLRATHEPRLNALEQRLRALVRRSALPIAPAVYSPATALESFRVALEALDFDLAQRQVLLALYEPAANAAFAELYDQALQTLDRRAAEPAATAPTPSMPAHHQTLCVDDATLRALRREPAGGLHRADSRLAASLLALIRDTAPDEVERQPVVQRIALLCRLCASWFEPLTPAARQDVERLRFTLIKIVLADSGFLLSAGHPLRSLLRDACDHQDERRRRQACSRVDQVAMSAEFVTSGLPLLTALTIAQIDACLDQLRQHDSSREEARIGEARRQVAQALEHATLPHARPQGLRLFLRGGWGPLLTQRLLRHGRPSAPWQDALDLLDRILNALSSEATRVREFEALLGEVSAELFEAGMRAERCERLQQALREAYYELRVAADTMSAPAAANAGAMPGIGVLELPEFVDGADNVRPDKAPRTADDGPDLELRRIRFAS